MPARALVIEDSYIFQRVMAEVLEAMEAVDHVDVASTGGEGRALLETARYDVVFLDLKLPDMHGLELLEWLGDRPDAPPVIVVSASGGVGSGVTNRALRLGARGFVNKPSGAGFNQSVQQLLNDLKRAVAQIEKPTPAVAATRIEPSHGPAQPPRATRSHGFWITALAVSTGGPEALGRVIPSLPGDYPTPIVLVQHMPPLFTASLATSLNDRSEVTVVEADNGMELRPGHVYIAPGGWHLKVGLSGGTGIARLSDSPPECSVRPAADVLLRSLAHCRSPQSVLAVVMTGMGMDGQAGLGAFAPGRCYCMTQSAETCVVPGMPEAAEKAGLSNEQVPLNEIAARMTELTRSSVVPII